MKMNSFLCPSILFTRSSCTVLYHLYLVLAQLADLEEELPREVFQAPHFRLHGPHFYKGIRVPLSAHFLCTDKRETVLSCTQSVMIAPAFASIVDFEPEVGENCSGMKHAYLQCVQ